MEQASQAHPAHGQIGEDQKNKNSGSKNARERGHSHDFHSKLGGHGIGLEEITVMKLMEEIMEFDQEIKMKQRWVNARMKLLHNLLGKAGGDKTPMKQVVESFLLKLQPEYPKKISVNYDRGG